MLNPNQAPGPLRWPSRYSFFFLALGTLQPAPQHKPNPQGK